MQVVTQWVWVEGLRLSIRDGCSGSEAQVMSIMSGTDAVKQYISINSKQTSSTVTFCLKQPIPNGSHNSKCLLFCVCLIIVCTSYEMTHTPFLSTKGKQTLWKTQCIKRWPAQGMINIDICSYAPTFSVPPAVCHIHSAIHRASLLPCTWWQAKKTTGRNVWKMNLRELCPWTLLKSLTSKTTIIYTLSSMRMFLIRHLWY